MKYFCINQQREGTIYYEFLSGKWDEETFWADDSLYIHDDMWKELKLFQLFKNVIPGYSDYKETEVTRKQWDLICEESNRYGSETQEALKEIQEWIDNNFKENEIFTILGI